LIDTCHHVGVASTTSPWMRLAGLAAGTACLEPLLGVGLDGDFLGTAAGTIAVTTTSLLVARAVGFRFRLCQGVQAVRPALNGEPVNVAAPCGAP
jgi:hypothetical protein